MRRKTTTKLEENNITGATMKGNKTFDRYGKREEYP